MSAPGDINQEAPGPTKEKEDSESDPELQRLFATLSDTDYQELAESDSKLKGCSRKQLSKTEDYFWDVKAKATLVLWQVKQERDERDGPESTENVRVPWPRVASPRKKKPKKVVRESDRRRGVVVVPESRHCPCSAPTSSPTHREVSSSQQQEGQQGEVASSDFTLSQQQEGQQCEVSEAPAKPQREDIAWSSETNAQERQQGESSSANPQQTPRRWSSDTKWRSSPAAHPIMHIVRKDLKFSQKRLNDLWETWETHGVLSNTPSR